MKNLWCLYALLFSSVLNADTQYVRDLLARQFYLESLTLEPFQSVEDIVEQLHRKRLDPWSEITDWPTKPYSIRRNGYGLRVVRLNEKNVYLLPELGSPNSNRGATVFRATPPEDGDWLGMVSAGKLKIENDQMLFHGSYLAKPFELEQNRIRVDDFIHPGADYSEAKFAHVTLIDLRFNKGGRVDLAADFFKAIAGADIPLGFEHRRSGNSTLGEGAENGQAIRKARHRLKGTYVLVSRFTASTAEWLARNFQFYGATLIGERSQGKCLIQRTFAIGHGKGVRVAIGKLHPASSGIQDMYDHCDFGLVPDYWIDGELLITRSDTWLTNLIERTD